MANKKPKQQKREALHGPMYQDLWANDLIALHSPWDFKLTFGNILDGTEEKLTVNEAVSVHVSPQFMVRLIQTLQVNVARYEERFGPIQMPKGLETRENDNSDNV